MSRATATTNYKLPTTNSKMADIFNAAGQKMATMNDDNKVRDLQGKVIGSVLNNGDVYNISRKIGYIDDEGDVYEAGSRVGEVRPDGRVFDYEEKYVGKIVGGHIESGGAALLLLVR